MKITASRIAKLFPPRIAEVVHRKRLFRLLDERSKQGTVWVTAPAGSGKTTLVADYLNHTRTPFLWYKVDEGDIDPASFFFYLREAFAQVEPHLLTSLPLLTPEYMPGLTVFARRYFERLLQSLSSPYTIVLDNYHEAERPSPLDSIINTLMRVLPPGVTLIILSRSEPTEELSRFRGRGNNILYWSDIRFTPDETLKLLLLKDHLRAENDIHKILHQKSGGWVAGLILLIEWQKRNNLSHPSLQHDTPEEIFSYFSNEIISNEAGNIQSFLLRSSLLPTMTSAQAKQITGESSAESILMDLSRRLFFIERNISTETTYSYHPLFREYLLKTARERLGERQVQSIRRQAGNLLQQDGEIENAARLFIEGEEWECLSELLTAHAPMLLSQGRCMLLSSWFETIPHELQINSPWLLYWRGVCTLNSAPLEAQRFFERAFAIFTDQGDNSGSLLAWSGIINSTFFSFDNFTPLDEHIKWLEKWLENHGSFPSREVEVSVATSMLIALIHRKPGSERFEEWEKRIISQPLRELELQVCLPAFPFFAYYYLSIGDFGKCEVLVKDLERIVQTQPSSPLLILTLKLVDSLASTTSPVLSESGLESVEQALALSQESGIHILDPLLLAAGVHNALNRSIHDTAKEYLGLMEQVLPKGGSGHTGYYYFLSAWYHLCSGDKYTALNHARTSTMLAQEVGLVFPCFFCQIIFSLACYENGDNEKAQRLLVQSHEIGTRVPGSIMEYIYNLLSAYYAFRRKDDDNGLRHLSHGLDIGKKNGYLSMVNFWVVHVWQELCDRALIHNVEVDYVHNLIRKLKIKPLRSPSIYEHWPLPVSIQTLGKFAIIKNDEELVFTTKSPHKILQLLKVLIAQGAEDVVAEAVVNILWPDADGDRARKSLEMSLYRLRNLLQEDKVIQYRDGMLSLAGDVCRIDSLVFENLLVQASQLQKGDDTKESHIHHAVSLLERAVRLYRGSFLKEMTDPWVLPHRFKLQKKFVQAVQDLADLYDLRQEHEKALVLMEESVDRERGSAPLYLKLMEIYIAQGRVSDAAATYEQCKSTLKVVSGSEPPEEMTTLYRRLMN